jgi:hydrogenase maturation protein HypF
MALGALHAAGFDDEGLSFLGETGATEQEGRIVRRMLERGVNSPMTSSVGRLFDAVAAVVLGRRIVDYEAQAAIELEGIAIDEPDGSTPESYAFELIAGNWSVREPIKIVAAPMWHALVHDLLGYARGHVSKAQIAARFHSSVADAFVRAALRARETTGIEIVALSGGCLHNRRLARLLRKGLEVESFQVYQHRNVGPGDGGLSYGQAVVAAARLGGK